MKWRMSEIHTWKLHKSAESMEAQWCFWNNEEFSRRFEVALSGWKKMPHKEHSLVKQKLSHSAERERSPTWGTTAGEDPHSCGPEPRGLGQDLTEEGRGAGMLCAPKGWRTKSEGYPDASAFWTGWREPALGDTREDQSSDSRPHPTEYWLYNLQQVAQSSRSQHNISDDVLCACRSQVHQVNSDLWPYDDPPARPYSDIGILAGPLPTRCAPPEVAWEERRGLKGMSASPSLGACLLLRVGTPYNQLVPRRCLFSHFP